MCRLCLSFFLCKMGQQHLPFLTRGVKVKGKIGELCVGL